MNIKVTLCIEDRVLNFFSRKMDTIEHMLIELKRQGDIQMAQIDDLNKAISDEDVEITTILSSITAVAADIARLVAAVKAGASPTDLTTQLTAVQSHLASLTTGAQQLKDADTAANA